MASNCPRCDRALRADNEVRLRCDHLVCADCVVRLRYGGRGCPNCPRCGKTTSGARFPDLTAAEGMEKWKSVFSVNGNNALDAWAMALASEATRAVYLSSLDRVAEDEAVQRATLGRDFVIVGEEEEDYDEEGVVIEE